MYVRKRDGDGDGFDTRTDRNSDAISCRERNEHNAPVGQMDVVQR